VISRAQAAGFDLTGVDIYVYAVLSAPGQKLLVLDIDAKTTKLPLATNNSASEAELRRFGRAVADTPALKTANVTQVVFNFNNSDDEGRYRLVLGMPLTTLAALGRGETADRTTLVVQAIRR
jgi:hypothetical protein